MTTNECQLLLCDNIVVEPAKVGPVIEVRHTAVEQSKSNCSMYSSNLYSTKQLSDTVIIIIIGKCVLTPLIIHTHARSTCIMYTISTQHTHN